MFRTKEQTQFSSIVKTFLVQGGTPLLLEGAAGLGKTRAYLAPLLASGNQVVICVPTRALATQLVESADMAATRSPTQTIEIFTPRRAFESALEYQAHKQACKAADILICTHQAALIDVLADGAMLGLPDRFAVLFDEADQLPDAAALRLDCSISHSDLRALGVPAGKANRATAEAVLAALLKKPTAVDEPAQLRAAAKAILYALDNPAWFHQVGREADGALSLVHRLPARSIKGLLAHQRLIFLSATLSINGSFADFKNALGLPECHALSTQVEPTKHGTLTFISEDWSVQDATHLQRCAEHIFNLREDTLVITTSHEDAQTLGALLPLATVRARDETTGAAAARMRAEGSFILIAAGAWAGLDTPIIWKHVVMPTAPYSPPTILDDHEVSRYVDSRNAAIRRFKQGLARGLRTPDAHCTIHLLDGRFNRPEFQKAIPARFNRAYQAKFGVVEYRTKQTEFRKKMISRYEGKCAISGCSDLAALEAAHIGPKGGWRTNHEAGILLRADLHRLFDAGKLVLDDGKVLVLSEDPYYLQYAGKAVELH